MTFLGNDGLVRHYAVFVAHGAVPTGGGIMFPVGDIATHQSLRGPR